MLLLDTSTLAPEDRVAAFRSAFDRASVPCRIEHLAPEGEVHSRMHLSTFGQSGLFSTDATGFRLVRTDRHVRMEGPQVVALAVQSSGVGQFSQFGQDSLVAPGELMVSDLTAPYQFSWAGTGGSRAFQIPYDHLGLPHDLVRVAAPRLRRSPLHDLVRNHLRALAGRSEELSPASGAAALGRATVELVRALLVSAADDDRLAPSVRAETLLSRVLAYARAHLAEPDLNPERIAAAHNVSLRQLYKACAEGGVRLEQWLIGERLEVARLQLSSPSGRLRPIAVTAAACGFTDPSHFARRFRGAYGMAPREWMRTAAR
jgi:AraC-like DNA-binding protein